MEILKSEKMPCFLLKFSKIGQASEINELNWKIRFKIENEIFMIDKTI